MFVIALHSDPVLSNALQHFDPMRPLSDSENDAASLREALALLGDWEDEFDELFAPTKSPTPLGGQQQTAPPDEKRRRRAAKPTEYTVRRDARKAMLAQLQTQANDLQRLLENEMARRAGLRVNASALQQECEAMTVRQKHQRVAAVAENAALRERFLEQRAIARRIVRLARKAGAIAERLGQAPRPVPPSYLGPVIPIPQHVRYLDCHLDEARGILSSGAFKENSGDFQCVSFRDHGFDGLQSEFAVSWVVPFGVDAVTSVLWSLMSGSYHRGRTTDHQLTHSSADLVVTNFVSAPHRSGQPSCNHGQGIAGTSHGQTALRRYNDGDGSSQDGSRFLMMRIRGAVFDDAGTRKGDVNTDAWLQIEPLAKATASTGQVSRIRWCTRATGRPVDYDSMPPTARSKWVHSVVAGPMHTQWKENLMRNVQHIENVLLE